MNSIQDLILTLGSFIFTIALIPSVLSKDKPALATSITTSFVLFVFAGVYISLGLWFAMVSTTLNGIVWVTLAVQKIRQQRAKAVR